jgi:RimJ/RimL family protein N-acetyltransferase
MDLTGNLVKLRAIREEDAAGLAAILAEPEVARFAGSPMLLPLGTEHLRELTTARRPDQYRWAVDAVDDGALVGRTSIHRIDLRNRHCWFGIAIGPPARWGRGYGAEATILATRFAVRTLGMEKVYLNVFEGNDRGRRAYEKAGYAVEGELKRHHLLEGRLVTQYVMAAYRDHDLYV